MPTADHLDPETMPDLDAAYRQAREECGLIEPTDRAWIEVTGPDAAEYLQSQVTNDIESLAPGDGCYALLLDRKGHLQAEMRVLRTAEEALLVETGASTGDRLLRHLSMYKIGRRVEVAAAERGLLSLLGPGSASVVGAAPAAEGDFVSATIAGTECLVAGTGLGLDVICDPERVPQVRDELISRRAVPIPAEAGEILRIELGRPRLGAEMTEATMPAEAGIVERAISFTKGCYIGQEPVARLHYKGRPNRHLRGLRLRSAAAPGDGVWLGERELGSVGSVAVSPASGRIGLAILRREAEPGATVTVRGADGESEAEVVELPFPAGAALEGTGP